MSYQIQVTRGDAFAQAGARPISADEWTALLEDSPSLLRDDDGAPLGPRPLTFGDGVISITSPSEKAFTALKRIALSLNARLFGEDGFELGLSQQEEVVATLRAGFPNIDNSVISDAIATYLNAISNPFFSTEQRKKALLACGALDGDVAVAGFAYLLCRAVESGGKPEPGLTCAAAHLYQHRPALVDGFRAAPTASWVVELEELAQLVNRKPGSYVVRRCHSCSAKNRIPVFGHDGQPPKCGRCKTFMAALE